MWFEKIFEVKMDPSVIYLKFIKHAHSDEFEVDTEGLKSIKKLEKSK